MNTDRFKTNLLCLLFIIIGFFPFLYNYDVTLGYDWDYFNSHLWVIQSSIFNYKTLPLLDPWVLGGFGTLENPQNWLFSPFILLITVFSPYVSNLLSIIICSVLGFFLNKRFFEDFGLSWNSSTWACCLFVNCSWISLHFSEGHIVYRSFLFLPYGLYLMKKQDIKSLWCFGLLLSFYLLDGGIYTFIFTLVCFFIYLLLGITSFNKYIKILKRHFGSALLSILASILVASPKIIPVLVEHANRVPVGGKKVMGLYEVYRVFFDPRQSNTFNLPRLGYHFHEYGNYIGALSLILIIISCYRSRELIKNNKKILWMMFLMFYIGSGFFKDVNPYSLIEMIPFFNNAHIQSRYLIFFSLFYILFLLLCMESWTSRKVFIFFILIINLEFIGVKWYGLFDSFSQNSKKDMYMRPIEKRKFESVVGYRNKPQIYLEEGTVARSSYEPTLKNIYPFLISESESEYFGPIKVLSGPAYSDIGLTPKELFIERNSSAESNYLVNMRYSPHWKLIEGNGSIDNKNGLLNLKFSGKKVLLRYTPFYFMPVVSAYVFGLLIYFLYFYRERRKNVIR